MGASRASQPTGSHNPTDVLQRRRAGFRITTDFGNVPCMPCVRAFVRACVRACVRTCLAVQALTMLPPPPRCARAPDLPTATADGINRRPRPTGSVLLAPSAVYVHTGINMPVSTRVCGCIACICVCAHGPPLGLRSERSVGSDVPTGYGHVLRTTSCQDVVQGFGRRGVHAVWSPVMAAVRNVIYSGTITLFIRAR